MNALKYDFSNITPASKPLRILIVDDDIDMLMSLKDLLELEDKKYIVATVSNFDDAVSRADSFSPDIAILDIKLGSKNGIDLVQPLKKKFEHIACIMVTAYRGTEYTLSALRAGVDDFIYKPIEPDHLIATIEKFQKTQNVLREKIISDKRFRALFDQSFEFLFILSPTGRIVDINNTALKSIGIEKEFLLGRHFFEIEWWAETDGNKGKIDNSINKIISNKETRVELLVNDTVNQESIIDFSIKTIRGDDGNIIMIVPEGRDITTNVENELKILDLNKNLEKRIAERTHELKVSRDDAVRANSAKDVFLSQMSHELRTPMNAILGFTQIMELDEGSLKEEQMGYVAEIHKAADHLLVLINKILHLSQLGSSKNEVTLVDFDIRFSIENSINMLQPLLIDKNISIYNDTQDLPSTIVTADVEAIQNVFLKIISNAIKYNKSNGEITINYDFLDTDFIKVSITDTGIGIAEEYFNRVFAPFEQAIGDDFIDGVGVGLTICKKAMISMSGDIGFRSELGKGSTFWVKIPRPQKSE